MKKKNYLEFYLDVYFQRFHFFHSVTPEELDAYFNKKYGLPWECSNNSIQGTTKFFEDKNSRSHIVIWLRDKSHLGSLVHESVHAANFVLEKIGAIPTYRNDEPHAYLTTYIFDKCHAFMRKK